MAPPLANQPAVKDPRIIGDQRIGGAQKTRQFAKMAIVPTLALPVNHQHARGGAILQRFLGDQFGGKLVVKLR